MGQRIKTYTAIASDYLSDLAVMCTHWIITILYSWWIFAWFYLILVQHGGHLYRYQMFCHADLHKTSLDYNSSPLLKTMIAETMNFSNELCISKDILCSPCRYKWLSDCTKIDLEGHDNPNFPGEACPQTPLAYSGLRPPLKQFYTWVWTPNYILTIIKFLDLLLIMIYALCAVL